MTLKWNIATKGLRLHHQLQQKLRQKVRKLEVHLGRFPQDAVYLQVSLERHPKKPLFGAGLTLRLPSNILRVEKHGSDPVPAFDLAIRALLRELSIFKSALRREKHWKRSLRNLALARAA